LFASIGFNLPRSPIKGIRRWNKYSESYQQHPIPCRSNRSPLRRQRRIPAHCYSSTWGDRLWRRREDRAATSSPRNMRRNQSPWTPPEPTTQTSGGRLELLLRLAERNKFAAYVAEDAFRVLPLQDGIRSPGAGVSVYKGESYPAVDW